MESAAILDVLVAVGAFPLDEITPGKALLFPVVEMLSEMTEYPDVAREKNGGIRKPGCPWEWKTRAGARARARISIVSMRTKKYGRTG
jgi:hypothetical protein